MSALAGHLEDYLRMRRPLGFELGRHGQTLPGFVAYLEAAGASTVTVDLAVAWARLPEQRIKPLTACFRLSAVRGFARYLHAIDPANQIPPSGLLAVPRRRPAPYLYAPSELARLLQTTRRLRPPLRAATHRTLIGLLAATGMRLGEAGLREGGALAVLAVLDRGVVAVVGGRGPGVGLAGLVDRPAQHRRPLPGQPARGSFAVRGSAR